MKFLNRIPKRHALMLGATLMVGAALVGIPIGKSQFISQTAIAQSPAASGSRAVLVGGPATVRRLTESQYRATIADIFGADATIAGNFERGQREKGLLSLGTSRSNVSASSLEQYHVSAQSIASYAMKEGNRDRILPCKPASANQFDEACAQQFVQKIGTLLFRRPVTGGETTRYVQAARFGQDKLGDFYKGLQHTLAGMLVAPEFLMRIERTVQGGTELDSWSKASRLSFLLTDASPDSELLRAAGAGELETDKGLARQVDRLMASPNYNRAVRAFFQDLLNFGDFAELNKDTTIFPAFNNKLVADAQEETLRTILDLLVTQRGDYRDIFTTRETYLTRSLGIVYHMPVAPRNDWQKSQFPVESGRAGILSQASFLSLNSHPGVSSPTLRGKFIRQTFMCQKVPDPPANVSFSKFLGPEAVLPTARMRLVSHSENPVCAGCHRMTDPMGLTLENFDGLGAHRTHESGALIDASGKIGAKQVKDAVGLGLALHDDPQVPRCLTQKIFEAGAGYPAEVQEAFLNTINARFKQAGYRLPGLMRDLATSRNFYATNSGKPVTSALAAMDKGTRP